MSDDERDTRKSLRIDTVSTPPSVTRSAVSFQQIRKIRNDMHDLDFGDQGDRWLTHLSKRPEVFEGYSKLFPIKENIVNCLSFPIDLYETIELEIPQNKQAEHYIYNDRNSM